jgi:hypothetical protein
MGQKSDENLRGVPMNPYDLIREGMIVFGILAALIFVLAIVLGSPDYPTVRAEDIANRQPIAYLKTSANILAGNSEIQNYGPPYTRDNANAQEVLGVAPATWFGVTIPVNPIQDFILKPLKEMAVFDTNVAKALQTYQAASSDQQQSWLKAYLAGLDKATLKNGEVQIPNGDYGPVPAMMNGMLDLGRAGLLEGALESNELLPYNLNFTRSLLYFQDDVYHNVAASLNMLGETWGISHETGPYPGAWWLWPYTFLYQVPPMSNSPNGDLQVVLIVLVALVLVPIFLPFIPILNRIPRWLGIYKLIWRDWYRDHPQG